MLEDLLSNEVVKLLLQLMVLAGGGGAIAGIPIARSHIQKRRRRRRRANGEPVEVEDEETIQGGMLQLEDVLVKKIDQRAEEMQNTTRLGLDEVNESIGELETKSANAILELTRQDGRIQTVEREMGDVKTKTDGHDREIGQLQGKAGIG